MTQAYTAALTGCLRSGDDELRSVAVRHIEALFSKHGGNLLRAARASGISHRTLCRWVETDPDLRARLDHARSVHDANVIAQTTGKTAKP
jgi:hypothetical protein